MLKKEIRSCLRGFEADEKERCRGRFMFPESFIGFQGHFFDNPVLPGHCLIQAALEILETWKKRPVRLKEIAVAKFFLPVRPNDEMLFDCREEPGDKLQSRVTARVTTNGKRTAQLTLAIAYESATENTVF